MKCMCSAGDTPASSVAKCDRSGSHAAPSESQGRDFPHLSRSASPRLQSVCKADLLSIISWALSTKKCPLFHLRLCKHMVHVAGNVGQFRGILAGPDKLTSFLHQHCEHCGVQRTKCTSSSTVVRKKSPPKLFALPADSTSLCAARLEHARSCPTLQGCLGV